MKNRAIRLIISVIISLITLSGCQTEYPRDLVEIDSVADGSNPKLAIDLLDGLRTTARSYSSRDKYYYELLKIKANDKANIKHTSDSMIREIIDYYEGIGDKHLLPMAYYYGGRVYRNLGDAPQALTYFHKCMDHPLLSDELRSILFLQMGELYVLQNAFDLAIETYEKSYEYCREVGDSVGMVYALTEMGYIDECVKRYDHAKEMYIKALTIAKAINDSRLVPVVYSQLSMVYLNIGDYKVARKYLDLCRVAHHPDDNVLIESVASLYHSKVGDIDSIKVHIQKALKRERVYDKVYAYKHLMLLARKDRNIDATMAYLDSFLCYKDSVVKIEDAKYVRNLNATYNYYSRERENRRLEDERRRWQTMAVVGGFSAAILVAMVIILTLNYRRKKAEFELTQQKIKEVERLMADRELQENEQLKQREELHNVAMERLHRTAIYIRLTNIQRGVELNKKLTDEDWVSASKAVNEAFPLFDSTLNKFQYKLNKNEYRMSVLLKMQFPPSYIADLFCIAQNTVSSMRKRLYKKVFLKDGDASNWDNFVARL